jgi:hypothetical protein
VWERHIPFTKSASSYPNVAHRPTPGRIRYPNEVYCSLNIGKEAPPTVGGIEPRTPTLTEICPFLNYLYSYLAGTPHFRREHVKSWHSPVTGVTWQSRAGMACMLRRVTPIVDAMRPTRRCGDPAVRGGCCLCRQEVIRDACYSCSHSRRDRVWLCPSEFPSTTSPESNSHQFMNS